MSPTTCSPTLNDVTLNWAWIHPRLARRAPRMESPLRISFLISLDLPLSILRSALFCPQRVLDPKNIRFQTTLQPSTPRKKVHMDFTISSKDTTRHPSSTCQGRCNTDALTAGLWGRWRIGAAWRCIVWSLCESQAPRTRERAAPGWAKWKFPPIIHGRLPFASSPLPTPPTFPRFHCIACWWWVGG